MTYGKLVTGSGAIYGSVEGGVLTEIGAIGLGGWSDARAGDEHRDVAWEELTPETLSGADEYAGFILDSLGEVVVDPELGES